MADMVRPKMNFLGHIIWKDELENTVVIRFVDVKLGRENTERRFTYISRQDNTETINRATTTS